MAFCTKCGKKLDEDERFCSNCGTPVMETEFKKYYDGEKRKKVFFTAAGIIAVLLVLFLATNRSTCDWCGKEFFGKGYYDIWDTDVTICEDCARDYYTLLPYKNYKR